MRFAVVLTCAVLSALAPITFAQDSKSAEKLAPYYPTPPSIVQKMLEISSLQPGEKMFDLGSGDGRIVLAAATKFKADATGVELDESLARQSSEEIRRRGLQKTARIIQGDILTQDYSSADVVTVYLHAACPANPGKTTEERNARSRARFRHDRMDTTKSRDN
jgi:protein-L-isoaspartate O-methyltransferase